jgi:hypothetical protein
MLGGDVTVTSSIDVRASPGGAVPDGTQEALRESGGVGFQESQRKVPKDTSELMLSGQPPRELPDGSVVWGYTAPHALPVEYGSRPHFPPIEPLLGWARRVLGNESAAYAVQQKIGKYGTQPQPYIRPGHEAQKAALRQFGIVPRIKSKVSGLR